MSENKYAVMPFSDYVDICNSVRDLTTAPEAIKSGEVKAAIDQGRAVRNSIVDGTITTLTEKDLYGVYEIEGAFRGCSSLKTVVIPECVTYIGSLAFSSCTNLERVVIPNSVTYIGDGVFASCNSLTNISIPDSITTIHAQTFHGCSSLSDVTFGNGVKQIGYCAFQGCDSITEIVIPKNVVELDVGVFSFCQNLRTVKIYGDIVEIASGAFSNCSSLTTLELPQTVTSIKKEAFSACDNLIDVYYEGSKEEWLNISIAEGNEPLYSATIHYAKASEPIGCDKLEFVSNGDGTCYVAGRGICSHTTIEIPEKSPSGDVVIKIGKQAFDNDLMIYNITIPDTVQEIDESAFRNCNYLCNVVLGNSVQTIKRFAFQGCGVYSNEGYNGLTINFPDGLVSIETNAFSNSKLLNINLPKTVISIGSNVFDVQDDSLASIIVDQENTVYHSNNNCLIETDTKKLLRGCTDHIIPSDGSVTNFDYRAFSGCTFVEVTIPDSVTELGDSMFQNCNYLKTINMSKNVTKLPAGFVGECHSLQNFVINDNIVEIGASAFNGCNSLEEITIGASVSKIGAHAFINCNNLTDVYYNGDKDSWGLINISEYGNEALLNATIHYAIENPIAIFYPRDLFATIPTTSNNLTASVIDNNYITYTYITYNPSGEDPYYYPFYNITGGRYLNINYRTSTAIGMWLQIYLGSSGTGPSGPSQMLQIPLVTDGNWQTTTFDLQELVDRGVYDGSHIAYFRFDVIDSMGNPLPNGCSLDVRYIAFFNTYEGTRQPESNFFNPNYIETVTGPVSTAFAYAGHIDVLNHQGVDITGYRDKSSGSTVAKPGIVSNFTAGSLNVDETDGDEKILVMKGWAVVNGGQDGYFWSVDGQNWTEVTRGTYGLAGPDIQGAGEAYGVTSFNPSYGSFDEIIIDVSSYKGQTIPNLYIAVRSKVAAGSPAQQKLCNFLTFTNLIVPA